MKYAFAAAALVAVASAQSIADIPSCAIGCIEQAVSSATKCSKEDYACICKSQDALTAVGVPCVLEKCGAEKAMNEVLPAVKAICAQVADAPVPKEEPTTSKAEPATSKAEPTTSKAEPTTSKAEETTKAASSYEAKPTEASSSSAYVVTSVSLSTSVTGSMTTMAPSSTYPASSPSAPHASSTAESSPIATAGAAHFGIAGAGVLAALAAFL